MGEVEGREGEKEQDEPRLAPLHVAEGVPLGFLHAPSSRSPPL
ncbi:MAG: hypothetical protein ACYDBQ_07715 [Thermoplasmatota archaeon]